MVTLTIIFLLMFVPPLRRLVGQLTMALLTVAGIVAALGNGSTRRRGF